MAVINSRNSRRIGFVAAVLASVSLPGLALAGDGPGWRNGGEGDRVRQERSDDGGQGRRWQQPAPQQQQQAPQQRSEPPQQRQGGWAPQAQAPAPEARQQGGWNRGPVQQQAQQGGWNGQPEVRQNRRPEGGWQGRGDEDRRGGDWNRDGRPPQQAQQNQQGGNWQGGNRQQPGWQGGNRQQPGWQGGNRQGGDWADRDHRDRDHRDRDHRDGDWRDRRGDGHLGGWDPRQNARRTYNNGYYNGGYYQGGYYHGGSHGDRRWDHRWRDNRRYDWYQYRRSHPSYFRVGVYYSPYRNYRYQRLSVGYFLDSLFFNNRYWINDPWQYRLPDVYGPYRWVRYYDDAVLVDTYSGEVVDVIYNFFW